jgi:feruloyl esterase
LNQPQKLLDWGERAWRETTLKSKALITAYYGRPPRYAYWNGGGGAARQGLKAIQRFPDDYDGVAVGGLAIDPSHFAFAQVAQWQALNSAEPLTPEHLAVLNRAALEACDGGDGVKDGVIGDPERCRFDPAVVRCPGPAAATCLTDRQAAAVRRVYAPVTNPRTGAVIFGGLAPGSELGWRSLLTPEPGGFALDFFRYVVFGNADWDYRTLDFDRDVAVAERVDPSVGAVDPDLRAFVARGGKLLLWGGWADTAIPPSAGIAYYQAVAARLGPAEAARSVRLYMVPGMGHFFGGAGPDVYDLDTQAILEAWRERGRAPHRVVAVHRSNGVQDRTVLLCPYPQVARYSGRGDPADAKAFDCRGAR